MLLAIPGVPPGLSGPYARPPPAGPTAVAPEFCRTNAKPSAMGLVPGACWNVKSVVKDCTLRGVVQNTEQASMPPPSVRRSRVPFKTEQPLNWKPVAVVKPPAKLMPVGVPIVYVADPTEL